MRQFVDHIAAHLSDPSLPADTPLIQESDSVDMDQVDLKEIFDYMDKDGDSNDPFFTFQKQNGN